MVDRASAAYLIERCNEEHFFEPNYRIVFNALKRTFENNETVYHADVAGTLTNMGSSLGVHYLVEEFDPVFSGQHVYGAVTQLQNTYINRKISMLAHDLNKASGSKTVQAKDTLQEAQAKILKLASETVDSDLVPVSKDLDKLYDRIEQAHEVRGQVQGIKTGFGTIDRLTNGLNAGIYTILAARPSMGKSSLALCEIRNIVKNGIPVALFSLEMSLQQIQARLLSIDTGVSANAIRYGEINEKQWIEVGKSMSRFGNWPLYVDDMTGQTIEDIEGKIYRAVANYGIQTVYIDHLQLIRTKQHYNNRNDQLGYISSSIKGAAKRYNVSMNVLSQLSRALESRKKEDRKPMLSDLRESGNIEQDADIVKFLVRWEVYDETMNIPGTDTNCRNKANLEIAKNRDGIANMDVLLHWRPDLTKFTEVETQINVPDEEPIDNREPF